MKINAKIMIIVVVSRSPIIWLNSYATIEAFTEISIWISRQSSSCCRCRWSTNEVRKCVHLIAIDRILSIFFSVRLFFSYLLTSDTKCAMTLIRSTHRDWDEWIVQFIHLPKRKKKMTYRCPSNISIEYRVAATENFVWGITRCRQHTLLFLFLIFPVSFCLCYFISFLDLYIYSASAILSSYISINIRRELWVRRRNILWCSLTIMIQYT